MGHALQRKRRLPISVPGEKKKLRAKLKQRTAALTPGYIKESDRGIVQNTLSHPCYQKAKTISCFVGTASKIDTSILIEQTFSDGKYVAILLCTGKGIMEAREIHSLTESCSGMVGILEFTTGNTLVTLAEIDLVILPCVSCGRRGNRLGHRGGYYDRFLGQASSCPALVCRERLLYGQTPTEPHDITASVIIAEAGYFSHE